MFVGFHFPTASWIWQLFQALQNSAVSILCCLVKDQLSSAQTSRVFSEGKKKKKSATEVESTSLIVKANYCCSPSVWKPVVVRVPLSARGCLTETPLEAQISGVKWWTHSWMPWERWENEEKWVRGCSFFLGGSPGALHPNPASAWPGWGELELTWQVGRTSPGAPLPALAAAVPGRAPGAGAFGKLAVPGGSSLLQLWAQLMFECLW